MLTSAIIVTKASVTAKQRVAVKLLPVVPLTLYFWSGALVSSTFYVERTTRGGGSVIFAFVK